MNQTKPQNHLIVFFLNFDLNHETFVKKMLSLNKKKENITKE